MKKKFLTLFLGFLLCSNSCVYGATNETGTAELTAEALVFDIEVPSVLPIQVDAKGKVSVADNLEIINHSYGAVVVTDVRVTTDNGWSLVDFDTNFSRKQVDLKEVGLLLNGDEVQENGSVHLGSAWKSIHGNGGALPLEYDVNLAAQSRDISEISIATIVYTLDWDVVPGVEMMQSDIATMDMVEQEHEEVLEEDVIVDESITEQENMEPEEESDIEEDVEELESEELEPEELEPEELEPETVEPDVEIQPEEVEPEVEQDVETKEEAKEEIKEDVSTPTMDTDADKTQEDKGENKNENAENQE